MFNIILPKIHIEIEKWKFNRNYQLYVSNMGNFKDKTGEKINLKIDKGGYLQVPTCNNKKGTVKYLQAHRIVMETWCPKINMWKDKLTVDHLDHNKRNNTYKNLEWVTQEENQKRASNDLIYDDKDTLIQSLQDKIKYLENLNKEKVTNITIVGIKNFTSWNEVKNWLSLKNPEYNNASIENIQKRITKAYKNNKMYAGYNWIIK